MKKVLFATTALIATAGVASADITLGGAGRIGVTKTETGNAVIDNRAQFDLRASGETDALTFGTHVRMRSTNGVATLNAGRVFVSMAGLTIHAGNIPGPLDSMAGAYAFTVGYTGGTFQAYVGNGDALAFSSTGAGAQGIQVDYSIGDLSLSAAHQPGSDINQFSATYSVNGLTVAAGTQIDDGTANDVSAATISYKFGDFTATYGWGETGTTDIETTTFTLAGTVAEGLVAKVYGSQRDGAADDAFGVGASYALGGGASLGAGFENLYNGTTRSEIGLSFSF